MGCFDSEGDAALFSKAQSPLRWIILFLSCVMMIGNYYCYDNPAALKSQIDDQMGNPSDYETLYSLLYTVYSIPNVILPFFGGFFVDKFGVRGCIFVFASLIFFGQVVFSIGLSAKSWPIMYAGRVLYGFGGESLAVGNSAVLAEWFAGKELAFAFGLNLSIARLGSVINNLVSPQLANADGVVFALWFGVIVCGVSLFCTFLIIPVDKAMDAVLAKSERMREPLLADVVENGDETDKSDMIVKEKVEDEADEGVNNDVEFSAVLSFPVPFWVLTVSCVVVYGCVLPFNNVASTLLLERDYFMEQPNSLCALEDSSVGACQLNGNNPNEYCNNGQYYQPPLADGADVDCENDSDDCYKVYCDGQSDAEVQATTVMSIPYIISACLSPVLGGFVDKFGMRAIIATIAPLCLLVVHALLGYTDVDPVGPLVGQGLSYSGFAAVLWPSIPLVVEPKYIGLGYGFVTAVQNIGLALFPLVIATIYTESNDKYIPNVELFFMMLAILGTLVGIYLNVYDMEHDNVFNRAGQPDLVEGEVAVNGDSKYDSTSGLLGGNGDDEDEEEAADVLGESPVRTTSVTHSGHHAPTFTVQEELFRARVASGEVAVRSHSRASRDGSRQKSADILALQREFNPVHQH